MAHRVDEGVYEFGIRVVIPDGSEALWSIGAGGLEAEVLRDNTLIGFVPHIAGSEDFTDQQATQAIATTSYSEEGLHPARRDVPPPDPARSPAPSDPLVETRPLPEPESPAGPPSAGSPDAEPGAEPGAEPLPGSSHPRWRHWPHR
ncbi:MAG: hypothetical protein FWE15_08915 [Actinomycetia bacterium]|nr:hypothetical protein [Actinomycetes bacterium]MCL2730130.1 hypothetical protein [Actinomycetes bacterium]